MKFPVYSMGYDFAIITSVKNDGTEYNILGLLRSLEMLDINIPVYIACFNHPPKFDLISELEVCGDLICNFDIDDSDLQSATLDYAGKIASKKYKKILYVNHNLRVYKIPDVPDGISIASVGDGIDYCTSDDLKRYMKCTIVPDLLEKCNL